ncbi:MAG: acyltransferase [Lachnospiraceae bacterium]|nr:acyltransferase [Lachnospiraceae bacterium]
MRANDRNLRIEDKNRFIELLRFVLCMIIFMHHSGHVNVNRPALLPSGGLAADAFFILTGYYAIRHVGKLNASGSVPDKPLLYSIKYTIKKLIRVFPYAAFGTIIVYILECVIAIRTGTGLSLTDIIAKIKPFIIELFFLPLTGLMSLDLLTYRNAPMWYLSAMLFALPILMWLSFRLCKIFSHVLVWLVPIAIQVLFLYKYGGILPWQSFLGFINTGILRGLSSMLLGCAIYYLLTVLNDKLRLTESAIIPTIIEVILYIIFLFLVIRGVTGIGEMASLYIILVAICFSLSKKTYTSRIGGAITDTMGRLSMPIFCIHWGIYRWVGAFFGYLDYKVAILMALILCIVTAYVLMILTDKLTEVRNNA